MTYVKRAIFIVLGFYCLNLSLMAQGVQIKLDQVTMKHAMKIITEKTNYLFVYSTDDVNTKKLVSINANTDNLPLVIKQLTSGQALISKLDGRNIILSKALLNQQPNMQIKGVVYDKKNDPVIGATIMENGTSNGTITDYNGQFTLTVSQNAKIKITYIGYLTVITNAQSNMIITLQENTKLLNEVVVTGYSTQRKADLTGAVSVVNMSDVENSGENNAIKALQGRLPGINISSDGSPSGASTVRIRGIGTLNDNNPLYIIDGMPTTSGMQELNSNDIASIQVLKDAASASIYGSRAANGVIIITTKKGKEGKIKVNFDASLTTSSYQSKVDMMSTQEYATAMWQAYVNDGINPNSNGLGIQYQWGYNSQNQPQLQNISYPQYIDEDNTMRASDTDWLDEITRHGTIQQYNLSVSNGTNKGNYFFSVGYYGNEGIIKDTDFQRLSTRMNSKYKLIEDCLTIGQNFTLSRTKETSAPGNIISDALDMPTMIPVHTESGGWGGPVGNYPDRQNVARVVEYNKDNEYTYWRFFGNAFINLKLYKGLNIRSNFGLDYSNKNQRNFTLPYTTGYKSSSLSAVDMRQEHWSKWMWNAVATYNLEIGKHRGDAMIGVELNNEESTDMGLHQEDFSLLNPDYMWPDAGVGQSTTSGIASSYALVSLFGKLNYSYRDKYLAACTIRRDGSSRFGKNNQYATFPAFSLGWRISNEDFMASTKSYIDDLKLRASWGQTGNQSISNLARYTVYKSNYGTDAGYSAGTNGTSYDITGSNGGGILPSGFQRVQLGNDDLKWETTTQTNIGLDFTLFNQSVYGSLEYFNKRTKDILVLFEGIAAQGEGAGKYVNAGSMKNIGYEFSIGYRKTFANKLKIDVNANISTYQNEVLDIPETVAANGTFGGNGVKSVIGHAIYSQAGYVCDGIFQNEEEVLNHATQEGADIGRLRYRDLDGNNIIDENDQTWIYDPTPAFNYGVNVHAAYKNFDVSLFWQGSYDVDVMMYDIKRQTDFWSVTNVAYLNKGSRVLNAWSAENTNSKIPALTTSDRNSESRLSSYYVEDGSYLKLRQAQIGYNFPSDWINKIKVQKLRLYVSGQNLLTFKSNNFSGEDPENPTYGYPIPRNFTVGLNIEF